MMKNEWYNELIDDCQTIITEKVYRSRMELIEAKHMVGERICTDKNFKKLPGSQNATLQRIFKDIGIGRADGYACVAFYEKYPKLSAVVDSSVEQKNLSWDKIKRNYLPAKKDEEKVECQHETIIKICQDCRKKI